MCCCIFFPSLNTRNQFFFLFFFTFGFSDQNTFSLSLFLCFPRPSLFFPSFPPSSFILSLSLSLFRPLSMFLLSCLVPDIGVVDHVNIFVLTCVHFGVFGVVLPPVPQPLRAVHLWHALWYHSSCPSSLCSCSHSFLGGNSQHNCRGALAFLWPGCLSGCFHSLKQTFCPWQTCLSYGWEKGCRVASKQTRQTCWTKGSGNPPPPTDSLCSALAQLVIISTRVPVYSNVQ